MRTFGKLERNAQKRSPPSTQDRGETAAQPPETPAPIDKPTMSASLRERVIRQIDPSVAATVSREVLRGQIEEIIHDIANQERLELSAREQVLLAEELADDMTGYGPLRPLLLDDTVSDVMVNGPNAVFVERKGKVERVAIRFRDNDHIASVAQKIAGRVGRRVDEFSPMVDCRLQDGSRVNIILPPLAIHSPCISIRKFPSCRYDIAGMIENGTMTAAVGKIAGDRRPVPAQHPGLRRHRLRQDDAIERAQPIHRSHRAHCHDRGCCGAAAPAAARDQPRDPAAEPRRHGAGDATGPGVECAAHAS